MSNIWKKIAGGQGSTCCALAAALLFGAAGPASAQTINEFPGVPGGTPAHIVRGPDQAFWITDPGVNAIIQLTQQGVATPFTIPTAGSQPTDIIGGPDGNLWFTEAAASKIGRMTPAGVFAEFSLPNDGSQPAEIATGPDGNLWFTETAGNRIGRITPAGAITEFPVPTANSAPAGIRFGSDGNLWFTESAGDAVARITLGGTVTEFPLPSGSAPDDLVVGFDGNLWVLDNGTHSISVVSTTASTVGTVLFDFPIPNASGALGVIRRGADGTLWFTIGGSNQLAQITEAGEITEFDLPTPLSMPLGLAQGVSGDLWFVESAANRIGQFIPFPDGPQLFASVLPGSQSVERGVNATVFATILNAGSVTAHSCGIVPLNGVATVFDYQTTAAATNLPIGTENEPVDIPAGAGQTFILDFRPKAAFVNETVDFGFSCADADSAPIIPNVDTLDLSSSAMPVPNVIALALTPSRDGILDLPGTAGSNAFVVATDNLGITGTFLVTLNPGTVPLPLDLSICQTDPASGQCLAAPTRNLTATIDAGATPTFALFATATGAIALDPSNNRLIVRFLDAANNLRGATSVAVQTQ
jgi:streptogramin lyase